MRDLIKEILEKYPNARATSPFGGQHEIRSLFDQRTIFNLSRPTK